MGNWVVSLAGPRRISLEPCPPDPLGPGQVRVRTSYSGISAGTELTLYRGSNPRLSKDWDDAARMFVPRQTPVPYPLIGFGYEEVGEVVEVGAGCHRPPPGAARLGHLGAPGRGRARRRARSHPLPAGLDPLAAVFARPGAIALTAVLAGDLHLGDWVAVFGQGVIGLLATRLAVLSGARVVAVDPVPGRLEHAARYGARSTVDVRADVRRRRAAPGHRRPGRGRLPGVVRRRTRRCTRRSAPPHTPAGSWPPASTRARPTRSASARSSTTTASSWWPPRSPGPPPRRAWPAGGPETGSRRPSWTWWPNAASIRCRWSATSSTPARSPTPSRCSTAAPVTSSKSVLRFSMTTIALACQEQLLPGTNLIQKYALAAALGYQGIELRGRGDLAFARRLPELRRARAAGVVMPTVCVEMDHFIGDFDAARSADAVAQPALPALGDRRAGRRRRDDPGRLGHVLPAAAAVRAAAPAGRGPAGAPRRPRRAGRARPAPRGSPSSWNPSTGTRTTWSTVSTRRWRSAPRSGCRRSGWSPTPST